MSRTSPLAPRAVIVGLSGPVLTAAERAVFARLQPLGFILFQRNVDTPAQVASLTAELRAAVGRSSTPILIDQEGGRVQRLGPPHWKSYPPAGLYGALAARDRAAAARAVYAHYLLIGRDLATVGITVACAPVLDLGVPGANPVIGDRAFGSDPALVTELARAAIEGLHGAHITPVIKHVPGHGRATADSHKALPTVAHDLRTLEATDFAPFRALAGTPWAMVAHVRYPAIDTQRPISTSAAGIGFCRQELKLEGVLIADDIGMGALTGPLPDRARATLNAGCDVTLLCNADLATTEAVLNAVPALTPQAVHRLHEAEERRLQGPLALSYRKAEEILASVKASA